MITRTVKIMATSGLQVEAAGKFCDLAMEYESKIHFTYRGGNEANAKSVLSILGAGIHSGEEIVLIIEGKDENEAADALEQLLSQ